MAINTKEAFVYCWTNLNNGKKYIGYHKGSVDDGYICSSKSDIFWEDWETCEWTRQIIAFGTIQDCVKLEYEILNSKDIDLFSEEWYNNNKGGGIIFTPEVRAKMSRNFSEEHKVKLSESAKKRARSKEHIDKLHAGRRGTTNTAEHKEILRNNWLGKTHKEETKNKMSEAKLRDPNRFEIAKKASLASAQKRKNDPEYKKAQSERMKLWWAERKKKTNGC